jgi:hypothetical protein
MNTRHSPKISRTAAGQLLDGQAGAGSDPLARVLAAAAAPARDSELTGEQVAVAAFEANHLVPDATSQKRRKSMLAKLLTAKVLVSSFAVCATGGVALAASSGALTSPTSPQTSSGSTGQPASSPNLPTPVSGVPRNVVNNQPAAPAGNPLGAPGSGTDAGSQPGSAATAQSLPQSATALCRALIGDVSSLTGTASGDTSQSGQEQALSSSDVSQTLNNKEFSSLESTAQSASAVPDYCALLLDLPQLPQPSDLTQLPSKLLGQLLTALPTATLVQDLTSLPSSTLSQVLTALPTSALSQVLTSLPSSALSQVLTALPTSALSQVLTSLPSSTLSQVLTALPTSALSQVLTSLPSSVVTQLLNELPTSTLSQLPSQVLSQLPSSVLSHLPTSVLSGLGL